MLKISAGEIRKKYFSQIIAHLHPGMHQKSSSKRQHKKLYLAQVMETVSDPFSQPENSVSVTACLTTALLLLVI